MYRTWPELLQGTAWGLLVAVASVFSPLFFLYAIGEEWVTFLRRRY